MPRCDGRSLVARSTRRYTDPEGAPDEGAEEHQHQGQPRKVVAAQN